MEQAGMASDSESPVFLQGGGEMGAYIRAYDWAATALGSFEGWPQSLRSAISICLNSNFPIAIYWGEELTLLYNDAWSPIPGNKHPWSLGKPARDVWPDIWDAIEPQFQKAFSGEPGGSKDALLPMQRHGYTEECYFDFTFTPVNGESGKVEGIFNAVIETTFRIISERRTNFLKNLALITAEAKTEKQLLDQAVAFIEGKPEDIAFVLFYSGDGHGIRFEQSSISGSDAPPKQKKEWPFEAAAGKVLFLENISDYLGQVPAGVWPEAVKEGCIIPLQGKDGASRYFVCGLNARRRFDEEYLFFLESFRSALQTTLNSISALEEERKKAAALLEIDRAKTTFFTNISHEFRTPLTLMLGSLELLLRENADELPANIKHSIEVGHRNALRLLRLVNNLLDFSRLEAGKVNAHFERINITALTKGLANSFSNVVANAGLAFHLDCEEIGSDVSVDRQMWEKIVLNLLSNAFKYTFHGSITVRLTEQDGKVVLKVADTGVGIPAGELPKMFQRFHRVDKGKGRTFEGTGIGLSLVKELVQIHNGSISVASEEGQGSVFTVIIPKMQSDFAGSQASNDRKADSSSIADAFLEEAHVLATPETAEAVIHHGHQPTILVVEDNKDMRDYIAGLLRKEFNVFSAVNGADALRLLMAHKIDLVLSDMMMPVMDGATLIREMRRDLRLSSIPLILLSARAGEEAKVAGFDTGADDYLVKPFSTEELKARVRSQINLSRKRANVLADMYRLFDDLPFAIAALKGPDLVIEYINQYNLDIWQQSREGVLGKPLFEARPDIRSSAAALHEEVYRTGRRFEAKEIPVQFTVDGQQVVRYFDALIDPMRDEQGNIIGQIASSIEVTDKVLSRREIESSEAKYRDLARSLEVKVEERTMELTRSNDDLQQFAHVASHDLKEPVRKIMMFANLVARTDGQHLSPEGKISLQKVNDAAERMMNMVNGVLAYSKLGAIEEAPVPIDLNETISSVESDLELLIAHKRAIIVTGTLPTVLGAPVLIHQLFYNLINNALKFSKPAVPPRIIISGAADEDSMAKILIADNGIGFEQEYAERIFKTFTRLNTKDQFEGTGLGLSLCRKIVERQGGRISAHGEVGVGATFTVTLPVPKRPLRELED